MFTIFKMVAIVMLIITGVVRLGQGKPLWCRESKDEKVVFFINNSYYIWTKGITTHSQSKLEFFLNFSSTPKNCQKGNFLSSH